MKCADIAPYVCTGKQRFTNPQLAHAVNRRRNKGGARGEVYRCSCCGYWHIGVGNKMLFKQRTRSIVDHAHA